MPSVTAALQTQATVQMNVLINPATGQEIPLAMQRLELNGRLTPVGALLRTVHQFKCGGDAPMEALYVSMLPRGGTLKRFIVKGEDFEVHSKLQERQKAREEYEDGLSQGHLSVLTETNNDGLVTLSVGQVRPGEEVTVILETVCGVEIQDKGFRFRYPFTLAPSYHGSAKVTPTNGGGKMELPSEVFGDLILPEWKSGADGLHQIGFKLYIEPGAVLDSVSSPSHRALVRPGSDNTAEIELTAGDAAPNRDLVVEVKTREPIFALFADATLTGGQATGEEPSLPDQAPRWTAIVPSTEFPKAQASPRRVCFLIDSSGSMGGQPMNQAKLALKVCLSALRPEDTFGIVNFNYTVTPFDQRMAPATDANRNRAVQFVDRIYATGGTELLEGLSQAVEVLGGPGGDIFLLTDGQVFQTGPIVEQMAAAGTRVHVLGIGTAAQDRFLAQLSRRTKGTQRMLNPGEDVAGGSLALFNAVRFPVQVDVKAEVGSAQSAEIGTVWEDRPAVFNDPGLGQVPNQIELSWGGGNHQVSPMVIPVPDGLVALLAAGRRIEDLESSYDLAQGPARKAIEQEMKAISQGYALASRMMSLVAVIDRIGDMAGETAEQRIVPVGFPEGQDLSALVGQASVRYSASIPALGGGRFGVSPGVYTSVDPNAWHSPIRSLTSGLLAADGQPDVSCFAGQGGGGRWNSLASFRARPAGIRGMTLGPQEISDSDDDGGMVMAMPAAGVAGWADEPNYALIGLLTTLQSDGGVEGKTPEVRVLRTILLALAALAEDSPELFGVHLARMAGFIGASQAQKTVSKRVAELLTGAQPLAGDWLDVFSTLGPDADDKTVKQHWARVRKALVAR